MLVFSFRTDFALEYKGILFGVVEVKTPEKLLPAAMLQMLMTMVQMQYHPGVPYIGILTDGFRYILTKLQGKHFVLERQVTKQRLHPLLMVHSAENWNELFQICNNMDSIIKTAIANITLLSVNSTCNF